MFNTREKKERSLGVNLFLKATRCNSPKCVLSRNPHPPGMHGKAVRGKRSMSEFGTQLREKQKIKAVYGIRESAMKKVFQTATKSQGITGAMMWMLLERRLDNVVYRLGFAPSRSVGRQLVGHGHIMVNGRRTDIPSYLVKVGDKITIRKESKDYQIVKDLGEKLKKYEAPVWLKLDNEKIEGVVAAMPKDVDMPFDANMVVDYYSK